MAKWYAVQLDNGITGIVNTWDACEKLIKTCPSNARYKKFSTMEEAEKFIGKKMAQETKEVGSKKKASVYSGNGNSGIAIAYVDGSYNSDTDVWGYGVVLFPKDREEETKEFFGDGTADNSARNVTGEIHGALRAVQTAISQGFAEIVINYDYQGIEFWATGAWKAKQPLTQNYQNQMNDFAQQIKITFQKVKAHSGVKHNERADQLAKIAAGIK